MKQRLSILFGACLLSLSAGATIHNIQVADFQFTPATGMTVQAGDTVQWTWVSGSHTTTSATIPTGASAWDQPITSSANTYRYVPHVAGVYNYVCTPHASMGMTGSFTVVAATDISTLSAAQMKVSPNPVSASLRIELEGKSAITLIDATGKAVYALQAASGVVAIPVAGFANGVYFIRVERDGQVATERIVVAH